MEPIAILGLGCRFPGADDLRQYWSLLREGRDAVTAIPADRWSAALLHDPDPEARGKIRSWRGGFVKNVDAFDWRAFRLLPREARAMDPQHRLLLEVAWEALEDAGLPLESVAGTQTGVFVGLQWNDYLRLLARDWSRLDGYTAIGNAALFAANRVSHCFDLRGPSLSLDCGCVSGLVVLQQACQALWLGEIDTALVGAVELMLSPDSSIMMTGTGMLSSQGRCRTFDRAADGFVRGEGCGVLVLKRASQLTPADRPYALVRGVAVNHNGHNEWIMASSLQGQVEVVRRACRQAAIDPSQIDYVELHALGSPRGDAVEAEALATALASAGRIGRPCLVGSVKPNLGHLGPAAGTAALIKTALALYHGRIPPMIVPEVLNPAIPLEQLGLALPREMQPWPQQDKPRFAAVTALSLGGGNAHAILSDADALAAPRASSGGPGDDRPLVLPLSARSPSALADMVRRYRTFLDQEEDAAASIESVCFTASVGRTHHEHRLAVVGRSRRELALALEHARPACADEDAGSPAPAPSAVLAEVEQYRLLQTLARLYEAGRPIDWRKCYPDGGRITSLPPYAWQRQRLWPDWLDVRRVSTAPDTPAESAPAAPPTGEAMREQLFQAPATQRRELVLAYVAEQARRLLNLGPSETPACPHARLGFDSLSAHELSTRLEWDLGVRVPVRDLLQARSTEGIVDSVLGRLGVLLSQRRTGEGLSDDEGDSVEELRL